MVEEIAGEHRVTLGADKGYDRKEFVQELRDHQVTPHFAQQTMHYRSAHDSSSGLFDQSAKTQTG